MVFMLKELQGGYLVACYGETCRHAVRGDGERRSTETDEGIKELTTELTREETPLS